MQSKSFLRKEMKKLVNGLDAITRIRLEQLLSEKLNNFVEGLKRSANDFLGVYSALEDEPKIVFPNIPLAFPRIKSESEMSYCISPVEKLEIQKDFFNKILAPREDTLEVLPFCVIIPGLAYDRKGVRLGRGKGYFDRYLAKYEGIKIGICFQGQLTNELDREDHDVFMDAIITENEIVVISKKKF